MGNNRSRDGRGGKHSRNRWRATTGPPDAEEVDVVVGGAVGGRLKDTCRGRPAVSAAARGPVAPAQRGVPCAAAVQVARAISAM